MGALGVATATLPVRRAVDAMSEPRCVTRGEWSIRAVALTRGGAMTGRARGGGDVACNRVTKTGVVD